MAPDPQPLDDPFDTSDELMAEAAAMEARAAQRREASINELHERITPMAIEHNSEGRAARLAEQEAIMARADAKESRLKATQGLDEANATLAKAEALEAAGDTAGATELREEVAGLMEFSRRQVAQAEASEAAAVAADEKFAAHTASDQARMDGVGPLFDRSGAEEQAADQMEKAAGLMRDAGTHMTEAERLEAAAIDLRSRGVEGVERVDAAAKAARDEAEVQTLRARQQDPSHTFGTADDSGIDPDLIEIETDDATTLTDGSTEQPPADDLGIDPDLIEIEPNDPVAPTDGSTEQPPAEDSGIDPNLIEIEPTASADTDFGQQDVGATDFSTPDFVESDFADSEVAASDFADDGSDGSGFDTAESDDGFGGDFEG